MLPLYTHAPCTFLTQQTVVMHTFVVRYLHITHTSVYVDIRPTQIHIPFHTLTYGDMSYVYADCTLAVRSLYAHHTFV